MSATDDTTTTTTTTKNSTTTTTTSSSPPICKICLKSSSNRPMCHFPPNNDTLQEDILIHSFCGKLAGFNPRNLMPDYEIMSTAQIKHKYGHGPRIDFALKLSRKGKPIGVDGEQEKKSSSSSPDDDYFLVKEFETNLAAFDNRHTREGKKKFSELESAATVRREKMRKEALAAAVRKDWKRWKVVGENKIDDGKTKGDDKGSNEDGNGDTKGDGRGKKDRQKKSSTTANNDDSLSIQNENDANGSSSTTNNNNNNNGCKSKSKSTTKSSSTTKSKTPTPKKRPLPKPEKRLKRFRQTCPATIQTRIQRAKSERLYLLHQTDVFSSPVYDKAPGCTFQVLSPTGNQHKVEITKVPTCDCADYKKGNLCKHILFVMLKVIGLNDDDDSSSSSSSHHYLVYQQGLLETELQEIFSVMSHRQTRLVLANRAVRKKYAELSGIGEEGLRASQNGEKEGEGGGENGTTTTPRGWNNDCPICFDEMVDTDILTSCKSSCETYFHADCIRMWSSQWNSDEEVTCPSCKQPWVEDDEQPIVEDKQQPLQHPHPLDETVVTDDNYNFANLQSVVHMPQPTDDTAYPILQQQQQQQQQHANPYQTNTVMYPIDNNPYPIVARDAYRDDNNNNNNNPTSYQPMQNDTSFPNENAYESVVFKTNNTPYQQPPNDTTTGFQSALHHHHNGENAFRPEQPTTTTFPTPDNNVAYATIPNDTPTPTPYPPLVQHNDIPYGTTTTTTMHHHPNDNPYLQNTDTNPYQTTMPPPPRNNDNPYSSQSVPNHDANLYQQQPPPQPQMPNHDSNLYQQQQPLNHDSIPYQQQQQQPQPPMQQCDTPYPTQDNPYQPEQQTYPPVQDDCAYSQWYQDRNWSRRRW